MLSGLFPMCSLPTGAALAGLPLPEGGEETGADAHVGAGGAGAGICAPGKTPSAGWAHNTMGLVWRLCATRGSRDLHRDRSRGQGCLTGCQVLLSLCVHSPASPTSASTSSPIQPSSIPSLPLHLTPPRPSDSALPAVCPASQSSFLQELN